MLYINLNNTGLNATCSKKLRDIFKANKTLILLDLENNLGDGTPENLGVALEDVRFIQDKLAENKLAHDDERYK